MQILAILIAYLIGSLPMGYIVVKIAKKRDITQFGSGRTGGTNAMRAGGFSAGLLTAIFDLFKGFLVVWIARWILPDETWMHVLAGVAAVLGHNWSIWLYLLTGKLSAGAGTAPNVGAAMAFWPWIGLILMPVIAIFVLVIGYASVASMVAALMIPIVFYVLAVQAGMSQVYIFYGLLTSLLVFWALRGNIVNLFRGTERRVGLFAKKNENASPSL